MIIAVLLGLLIGLTLGALGAGGSILAVPVLVNIAGLSPGAATATSLVAVGTAAATASVSHHRQENILWPAAGIFIVAGIPGSWLGALAHHSIGDTALLLGFSLLMLVAAWRMLTACPSCTNVGEEQAFAKAQQEGQSDPRFRIPTGTRLVQLLAAGIGVGFLTGLFGIGGGFVIVPALTLALGLSLPTAIGTSLVVIVGNAVVALFFRGVDAVDWSVAVPFSVTMVIGSIVGALLAKRLPADKALKVFAGLLVLVAIANGVAAVL